MSQELTKGEEVQHRQIDHTDEKIDERSCPGIPASIVSSLRDYMQELEGHVIDHITKVRSLEETLLTLDSFRRTPVPSVGHVSVDMQPLPAANVSISLQPSHARLNPEDAAEIYAHLEQFRRFLDRHLHNIASLQSSLSSSSGGPAMSNHSLPTQFSTDTGSGIFMPSIRTKEDWEQRKLREEHKTWTQVFSIIVVISTFLTATVISAMSLGRDVWDDHTSIVREMVGHLGSASFLCAFTTTIIAGVSAAKAAYGSHAGFRGRRLPGIRLRLFICGSSLAAGFICLFFTVHMTVSTFLDPTAPEHPYSILPGSVFLSILLVCIYVDALGYHHYQWLRKRVPT